MGLTLSEQLDAVSAVSSAVSALATVGTLAAAWWIYKGTIHASSKPVLVFSVRYGSKWQLQNVGNGPAIEVIVYEMHGDGRVENATRCHPIAAGSATELSWLKVTSALRVVYSDSHQRSFTSHCQDSVYNIQEGALHPEANYISDQWLQEILAEPDGSSLSERDLAGRTWQELDILRCAPYARHGHPFNHRADIRAYFEMFDWYHPVDISYDEAARLVSTRERFEAHFVLHYQWKHKLSRPGKAEISEQERIQLRALGESLGN